MHWFGRRLELDPLQQQFLALEHLDLADQSGLVGGAGDLELGGAREADKRIAKLDRFVGVDSQGETETALVGRKGL